MGLAEVLTVCDAPIMELRAPRVEDRTRILALLTASEVAEVGAPVSDLADVDDLLAAPGLDLAERARISIDGARATAFVAVYPAPQPGELWAWLVLAPDARDQAPDLLRLIGQWSIADRTTSAPITTTVFELPGFIARQALIDDGWQIVHSYTRMRAHLDTGCHLVELPEKVTIRAAGSIADMTVVHAVLEDAIAGHWKHQRRTFPEFVHAQEARVGHDPSLWLLAEHDGAPAGAVIARDPPDRAWIAWLGVHPLHRHHGIATALLHAVFNELRCRGHRSVGVDVDTHNQTGAVAVYENAGMTVTMRADHWSKTYP